MKEDTKSALGIAYLYTLISALFAAATIALVLFSSPLDKYSIKVLALYFGFYAGILIVLYLCNRKQAQTFRAITADVTIRKATGAVISILALLNLFTSIPAIVYAVGSVAQNSVDLSVVLTLVSLALDLCELALGVYLLTHRSKTDGAYVAITVIGIAFWYTLLSAAFTLITKLAQVLIGQDPLNGSFLLWLGPELVLLAVLWVLSKKRDQNLIAAFQDGGIEKAVGALLIVSGLLRAAGLLNTLLNILWLKDSIGIGSYQATSSITQTIAKFVIVALQLAFGLYLLRAGQKSPDAAC